MQPKVKWLARALYAGAILSALAFGTHQLVAKGAQDPCDCPTVGSWDECDDCCNGTGFCTSANRCLC
jgi:hypothetical protein